MTDLVRMIAVGGTIGVLVGGAVLMPQVFAAAAEEPAEAVVSTIEQLFTPEVIDPAKFRRFAITFDETISTEVQRTTLIDKIAFGYKTQVAVVRTPSGTYSSDAIVSPHVRYPGVEVEPKRGWHDRFGVGTVETPGGTGRWITYSSGSFIYYSFAATPAARS